MTRASLSTLVLLATLLAACRGAGVSAPATASPSVAASAASLPPSPSVTPTPLPQPSFAANSIVQASGSDVQVREEPRLASRSLGTLPDDARSMVVDGPVTADGSEWYRLHALGLPRDTGCTGPFETDPFNCPSWFGWVAASGSDGTLALVEDATGCPEWGGRVSEELLFGRGFLEYLACFGGEDRTLAGYYPVIPDDAGLGGVCESPDDVAWIACNPGYEKLVLDADAGFFAPGFEMVIAPNVEMPERGQRVTVTGHYDDPAARDCAFGDEPDEKVLFCRAQFVVTEARAIDR
jgi:hypothetical protein